MASSSSSSSLWKGMMRNWNWKWKQASALEMAMAMENVACRMTFNRGVSKTPKGKKGLAVPKKKSVLGGRTKKKSKGEKEPRDMGDDETKRFNALAMAYLNASVPKRYRGEKDKKRELERHKLGLISKERQREIAIEEELKRKKDTAVSNEDEPDAVDGEPIPAFQLAVNDGIRLAKEYSRLLMLDGRRTQKEQMIRLKLKHEAILALPSHMRVHALMPDLNPFPAYQLRASLLPPDEEKDQRSKRA